MAFTPTKSIPVTLQRRAAELPCDGVPRYKVGRHVGLTYSEARAAILKEGDIGPNNKGGRILKRGTAKRLARLNRFYFRVAHQFVMDKVHEAQAEQAKATQDSAAAPEVPDEIAGTEVTV